MSFVWNFGLLNDSWMTKHFESQERHSVFAFRRF